MNKMSENFIKAVKSGKIVVEIQNDPNYNEELVLWFSYAHAKSYTHDLSEKADRGMPEVWECVEYAGEEGCFLHQTNGFITRFVSVNPESTRGACRMGEVKTTKGVVNVQGGWSSRPSVLYKYTGMKTIDACFDGRSVNLNWEVAVAIAEHLDLVIDKSFYTATDDNGEQSWSMFWKNVSRCPDCDAPVSSRIGHRCERCGYGYNN